MKMSEKLKWQSSSKVFNRNSFQKKFDEFQILIPQKNSNTPEAQHGPPALIGTKGRFLTLNDGSVKLWG